MPRRTTIVAEVVTRRDVLHTENNHNQNEWAAGGQARRTVLSRDLSRLQSHRTHSESSLTSSRLPVAWRVRFSLRSMFQSGVVMSSKRPNWFEGLVVGTLSWALFVSYRSSSSHRFSAFLPCFKTTLTNCLLKHCNTLALTSLVVSGALRPSCFEGARAVALLAGRLAHWACLPTCWTMISVHGAKIVCVKRCNLPDFKN
jgi:hypothetical protein